MIDRRPVCIFQEVHLQKHWIAIWSDWFPKWEALQQASCTAAMSAPLAPNGEHFVAYNAVLCIKVPQKEPVVLKFQALFACSSNFCRTLPGLHHFLCSFESILGTCQFQGSSNCSLLSRTIGCSQWWASAILWYWRLLIGSLWQFILFKMSSKKNFQRQWPWTFCWKHLVFMTFC